MAKKKVPMKPKLLLLNGPCGIGKSTLAQKYVDEHPMALNLDMDNVRSMMGQWRTEKERSVAQKLKLAHALTEIHLRDGYDVVIPNILQTAGLEQFDNVAAKCGAIVCEIALMAPKDEAIRRFIERGRADGNPTGFRPGGALETGGGVAKLEQMYDDLETTLISRPNHKIIEPIHGNIDATYAQIIEHITTIS